MPVWRAKKSFADRRTSAGLCEVVVSWSVRLRGDINAGSRVSNESVQSRPGPKELQADAPSGRERFQSNNTRPAVGILQLGFAKPSRTGQTKMLTSRSVLHALALASAIVVSSQASAQGAATRQASARPTQLP